MTSGRSLVSTTSLLTLLGLLTIAPPAAADDKQVCVAASEKAQQLKNAGKLTDAREQLTVCSRTECPKLIQQDCTQWMSEVLAAMPSVVPGAKDRKGRDIVDVRVSIDGKPVTQSLDGKAIVVDPGVHTFHFETHGAPAIDEQVVVKPGEKNRLVTVSFARPEEAPSGGGGVSKGGGARTGAGAGDDSSSSPPIAAFVVGGLGLVALGLSGVFLLGANSDARGLRDSCAPKCNQADVDDIQQRYNITGVTAGIGGALLVTGVLLFFLHGKGGASRSGASTPFLLQPLYSPGGATALVRF